MPWNRLNLRGLNELPINFLGKKAFYYGLRWSSFLHRVFKKFFLLFVNLLHFCMNIDIVAHIDIIYWYYFVCVRRATHFRIVTKANCIKNTGVFFKRYFSKHVKYENQVIFNVRFVSLIYTYFLNRNEFLRKCSMISDPRDFQENSANI